MKESSNVSSSNGLGSGNKKIDGADNESSVKGYKKLQESSDWVNSPKSKPWKGLTGKWHNKRATNEVEEGNIYVKEQRRISKDLEALEPEIAYETNSKGASSPGNIRTISKKLLNKREIHLSKAAHSDFGVIVDIIEEKYMVIYLQEKTVGYNTGINWGDQILSLNGNAVENFYADDLQKILNNATTVEMEIIEQPLMYRTKIILNPIRNRALKVKNILTVLGMKIDGYHITNVTTPTMMDGDDCKFAHAAGLQKGQCILSIENTCVIDKSTREIEEMLLNCWVNSATAGGENIDKIRLVVMERKTFLDFQQSFYQHMIASNSDVDQALFFKAIEVSL